MSRLFSILLIALTIGLFPPTVLALISNNAVPGDAAYPIKRKLEDGILLVASINPSTKAWFSASRTTRRFNEAKSLIAQGKTGAGETLDELVSQAAVAAKEIEQVKDVSRKEQLKQEMVQSIEQYNQQLGQIKQQIQPAPAITPIPTTAPVQAILPSAVPASGVSETPVPTLVPTPVRQEPESATVDRSKLDRVKDQLEQIKIGLQTDDKNKDSEKDKKEQPKQKEESKSKDKANKFDKGQTKD